VAGDGKTFPKAGQIVTIHYAGKLVDFGQKTFDSSIAGKPFTFKVGKGEVIKGLDDGIQMMSLKEKAWLTIHHSHAYSFKGATGPDPKKPEKNAIPPYANLAFKVALLEVKDEKT